MNNERMNKSTYNQAKEKSWVEPLSADENAELRRFLADNPELQQDWEEDAALTSTLNRLPNVPVSSNFTARVMQAVQREDAQAERKTSPWRAFWRRGWIPKFAVAAAMLCVGAFSFHEYQVKSEAKLVAEVKQIAETAPIPQVEWLKDFDTIEQMSKVQVADNDLLMAKQ
jgi:negative regulator of sigma E activity